jgi:hypothetical protein
MVGSGELWEVAQHVDWPDYRSTQGYFSLYLWFPQTGLAGGRVEIGAAIDYGEGGYAIESMNLGEKRPLRLICTNNALAGAAWADEPITFDLTVDYTLVPP